MPRIGAFALLVALVIAAPPLPIAAQEDELDRLRPALPDTSGRGMHSDFWDDPVGRFMDLLAAGATAEAKALQAQACSAWSKGRSASPLSGRFSVQGVELSLNRICGLLPASR